VTLFLAHESASAIVVFGVGGAYPGSGLRMGEVLCAESEFYGDLGATSPAGFFSMEDIGLPVVETRIPTYNRLAMQIFPVPRRAPFVTTTSLTGTDRGAREMEHRTGGAVKSMEGAAVAHVAALHGVPVGEVRAVSNIVGDRDTRAWRVEEAAIAAQEALWAWVRSR
jgi:futalosine hydrolase